MCNKCKRTGHYEAHCFAQWKKLKIDALVVSHLSSNYLIAWKDMQEAGLISTKFPAKVHEKKCPIKI
jgi:hypothetical protein